MASVELRWNDAETIRLLRGRTGPVARDLARRAVRVESRAKLNATGHHAPREYGQGLGPNVQTGRLRGSITWKLGEDSQSLYADVGTSVGYGVYVEKGTWRMPGGYPFLEPALPAAAGDS